MSTRPRVAAALLAVSSVACGAGVEPSTPAEPFVSTTRAQIRRVEVTLPLVGAAESATKIALVALVDGQVVAIHPRDGAAVEAGTVIIELGGPRVAARQEALRVEVETAGGSLEAAQQRMQQAQRRAHNHLATPGETATAASELANAEAHLAAARAAQARFLASLTLTAPTSGRFANRRVSPGQEVRSGNLLGEILDPGSIRIDAQVLPRPGRDPRPGQSAIIEIADSEPLSATVTAIQPMAGDGGTVRVWLSGDGLRALAPGTALRGHIVVAIHDQAVTVPSGAIVWDTQDRPLVFTGAREPYERRFVTIGEEGPGWIEITAGVGAGDEVITTGAYELYWSGFARDFQAEG